MQEQVPGETYQHGVRLRSYVVRVAKGVGPSVTLSRTHPNLVKKLFALEVPEIADGSVEIFRDRTRGRSPYEDRRPVHPFGSERQGRLHRPHGRPGAQRDGRAERREDRHRRLVGRPGRDGGERALPARVSKVEVVDLAARSARVTVPDYQLSLQSARRTKTPASRPASPAGASTSARTPSSRPTRDRSARRGPAPGIVLSRRWLRSRQQPFDSCPKGVRSVRGGGAEILAGREPAHALNAPVWGAGSEQPELDLLRTVAVEGECVPIIAVRCRPGPFCTPPWSVSTWRYAAGRSEGAACPGAARHSGVAPLRRAGNTVRSVVRNPRAALVPRELEVGRDCDEHSSDWRAMSTPMK